jgi:hypothetical protein
MSKVERIAPYVQGESLVLSQGPYTFALHRVSRSATGEVWWLYDETKKTMPEQQAGTISVVYEEGEILDTPDGGVMIPSARILVTFTVQVEKHAITSYLQRLFLLLGIQGEVQVYDSARYLGFLIR